DRWYACAPFLTRLADVEAASLLRVKSNRVFYRRAPERFPGQVGASRKDGERFQCKDEASHGEPDETWEGVPAKGARTEVGCWCWLVLCCRGVIDRGRPAARFRHWRRYDGPCPPFCSSWAPLLERRNSVEKRRDGPKAFIPSREPVIQSFAKRAKSRKRAKRA